jgi:Protein of unknown function DUF262
MQIAGSENILQIEIDKKRKEIRSDSYKMSIGEWMSLYSQGELEIHPEFQRFFRWTDYQKTRLIESILLGIPIPPIFVSQREDGIWEVVDGLQRLSTIYQFTGILKDESGKMVSPFVLNSTDYLPSLEGKKWPTDEDDDSPLVLTSTQRLLIKRAKIDVNILQKESDNSAKYELFQRLNTGGSIANPQEVRNCILFSLNPTMYQWMRELSKHDGFSSCIALNEKAIEEQEDMEILSRFLILRKIPESQLKFKDVGAFITAKIQDLANQSSYNFSEEKVAFETTFAILAEEMEDDSFKKYDPVSGKFSRGFMFAPFEAIALGIGFNYEKYHSPYPSVKSKIIKMWSDATYITATGRGKDARSRLPKLIPYGRVLFSP